MMTAMNGIERYERFLKSIGMPITLRELGANPDDIPALAAKVQRGADGMTGSFVKPDTAKIEAHLKNADR